MRRRKEEKKRHTQTFAISSKGYVTRASSYDIRNKISYDALRKLQPIYMVVVNGQKAHFPIIVIEWRPLCLIY